MSDGIFGSDRIGEIIEASLRLSAHLLHVLVPKLGWRYPKSLFEKFIKPGNRTKS